jgi:hypothetical protein
MSYTKFKGEDKVKVLALLEVPRNIYFIMSKLDWGHTKAYHNLNILVEEEEIKKIKTSTGRLLYKTIER